MLSLASFQQKTTETSLSFDVDRRPYFGTADTEEPERGLWCAVIHRAIEDARGEGLTGSPRDRHRQRETAVNWLLQPNRHFVLVCELAGLEPNVMRLAVLATLNAGPRAADRRPRSETARERAA